MFLFLSLILKAANCYDLDSILLVYGLLTPSGSFEYFDQFNTRLNISKSTSISEFDQFFGIQMIVDITYDQNLFYLLDQAAEVLNIFYLTATIEKQKLFSSFRFHAKPSIETKSQAITDLVTTLNWSEFSIISHNNYENIELCYLLKQKINHKINLEFFGSYSIQRYKNFIQTQIKSKYIKYLLVIENNLPNLRNLIFALKLNNFPKYGEYLLFITDNPSVIAIPGSLVFSSAYSTESNYFFNQTFNSIMKVIQKLEFVTYEEMKKICPNFQCNDFFEIINYKISEQVIVGNWIQKIEMFDKIVFPGGNYDSFLPDTPEELVISRLDSTVNSLTSLSMRENLWFKGVEHAVNRSNFFSEVPKAVLKLNLLPCVKNSTTWLNDCIAESRNEVGIAFITSIWMIDSSETYEAFENNSIYIPQISPLSFTINSSDTLSYLRLVHPGFDVGEIIESLLLLFISFEWRDFIIFTTDDSTDMAIYWKYLEIVKNMNLNIVNPEHLRIFPANYTRNDYEKYKDFFIYAKKSKCRIFHLLSLKNGDIIEGLYDVGVKEGDGIIMGSIHIYKFLLEDIEEKYLIKRRIMLRNALLTTIPEFKGEFGEIIKKELQMKYENVKFMCLTFDTVSILKSAFIYMQIKGLETSDIIYIISNQRVLGCSGFIYFLGSINHRVAAEVGIDQLVYDKKSQSLQLQTSMILNRFSTNAILEIQVPEWYGTSTTPSNYLDINECGFDIRDSVSSKKGRLILILVSIFVFIICVVTSYFSIKFYFYIIIPEEKKFAGSVSDILFLLFLPVELVQILSLEPSGGIFFSLLKNSIYLFGWDLFKYFDINFSMYWTIYTVLLCYALIVSVTSILFSVYWKHLDESINRFHRFIIFTSEHVLPIIVNLLFMPTVSMVLNIFECTESTGDEITQIYLNWDCTQNCFIGKHLVFCIVGGIILIFYVGTCCYLRIFWELIQYSLHFCTNPVYLASLNIFQVVIVMVHKNLDYIDSGISGFFISGIIFLFTIWTFKLRPYNYSRINVMQISVLIIAGEILLLSSFYVFYEESIYVYFVFFPVTGLTLFILMGWFKKSPVFFIPDKMEEIPKLIQFQFRNSIDLVNFTNNLDNINS